MSLWKKLKQAKRPGGGKYVNPGKMRVRLKRVKKFIARSKRETIAIELEVIEHIINLTDVEVRQKDGTSRTVSTNEIGSDVSVVIQFGGEYEDTSFDNYMAFVLALMGLEESEVAELSEEDWATEMDSVVAKDGTEFAGTELILSGVVKAVKADTHDYVRSVWENAEIYDAAHGE